MQTAETSVRTSIVVEAPIDQAFSVFTDGLGIEASDTTIVDTLVRLGVRVEVRPIEDGWFTAATTKHAREFVDKHTKGAGLHWVRTLGTLADCRSGRDAPDPAEP